MGTAGYEEVAKLAEDAVIVSTADPFHHGIGYGGAPEAAYWPDERGLAYARTRIRDGIEPAGPGEIGATTSICVDAKSDA